MAAPVRAGVERVPKAAQDDPEVEQDAKADQTLLQVAAPEVEDVLGHREADAHQRPVDDAVQDVVELVAQHEVQQQDGDALGSLLDDRRTADDVSTFAELLAHERVTTAPTSSLKIGAMNVATSAPQRNAAASAVHGSRS